MDALDRQGKSLSDVTVSRREQGRSVRQRVAGLMDRARSITVDPQADAAAADPQDAGDTEASKREDGQGASVTAHGGAEGDGAVGGVEAHGSHDAIARLQEEHPCGEGRGGGCGGRQVASGAAGAGNETSLGLHGPPGADRG